MCVGAVGLWKQATEVTTDLVNIITKPEDEEDAKFPRPQGWTGPTGGSGTGIGSNSGGVSGKTSSSNLSMSQNSSSGQLQRPSTGSSNGSWDNLADLDDSSPSTRRQTSAASAPGNYGGSPGIAAQERTTSSSTRSAHVGLSVQQPGSAPSPAVRNISSSSSLSNGGSNSNNNKKGGAATPSSDDFFATFGI